jgi:hypothetical protein
MRMCIDFTDLNKVCKKDPFPLPRIDASVDKAACCKRFSQLDYFLGYHQIWLNKEDEEKTSFTTPFGTYCYVKMPKGLQNAGSTLANMTKVVLGPQLQKNIIAYVDDIAEMSNNEEDHIADLKETFTNLMAAELKLNLEKCLRHKPRQNAWVYYRTNAIRANPEKTKAIISMIEPSTKKEVQKLIGRIAVLNIFISNSAEHSLPFFKALRGRDKVEWRPKQLKAF